jgi:hypothetical protein
LSWKRFTSLGPEATTTIALAIAWRAPATVRQFFELWDEEK